MRWMRCQRRRRTLLFPLSFTFDSRITAKLSLALTRGAGVCLLSVGSLCPRRELCGGVNPSNPPHRRKAAETAMGFAPAGLLLRGRDLQNQASVSI